jgi:hypothetical protein
MAVDSAWLRLGPPGRPDARQVSVVAARSCRALERLFVQLAHRERTMSKAQHLDLPSPDLVVEEDSLHVQM